MWALLDCNSFYCSCERLFRPDLEDKPLVVLSNNDGCIISRSDEAKLAGVNMGAPFFQVRELIEAKQVQVFSSNYQLYGDLSQRVMDCLRAVAGGREVEVYSIDEAFVQLDGLPISDLHQWAADLREMVERWTGIRVSIGVAPTKTLCKVANRIAKINKKASRCVMVLATSHEVSEALQATAIGDIWGIGYRYETKCLALGIRTAAQLAQMPEPWVGKNMGGVVGLRLQRELRGEPCIDLKEQLDQKKMVSTTRMFGRPVYDWLPIREAVATYTARAAEKLRRQGSAAGSVEVYLVNSPGPHFSYSPQKRSLHARLAQASSDTAQLCAYTLPLAETLFLPDKKYTKAGVIFGDLVPDDALQQHLFLRSQTPARKKLMQAIDNINSSQGQDSIKLAASGIEREWKMRQEKMSPRYTSRWTELREVS